MAPMQRTAHSALAVMAMLALLGWGLLAYTTGQQAEQARRLALARAGFEARLASLGAERDRLAEQTALLRRDLAERLAAGADLATSRAELAALEDKVEQRTARLATQQAALAAAGDSLAALQAEQAMAETVLGDERAGLSRRLDAAIADARAELRAVETELAEKQQALAALDGEPDRPEAAGPRPPAAAQAGGRERPRGLYRLGALAMPGAPAAAPASAVPTAAAETPEAAAVAGSIRGAFSRIEGAPPAAAGTTDWAEAQHALGLTLAAAGAAESGTRKLEEAVLAFRAALGEWTGAKAKRERAIGQANLGQALTLIGRRKHERATLAEATATLRAALDGLSRKRQTLLWAGTQHSLGEALAALAALTHAAPDRAAAIAAYRAARDAFTSAGAAAQAGEADAALAALLAEDGSAGKEGS